MSAKPTIACVARFDFPSFYWLGFVPLLELAQDLKVIIDGRDMASKADIVFIIKGRPNLEWAGMLKAGGKRLVYCPADEFNSAEEIAESGKWLQFMDVVLIHCERLRKYFAPICRRVEFCEHPVLSSPVNAMTRDSIVWSGQCQNLQPVMQHLKNNLDSFGGLKLKVMTNLEVNWREPEGFDWEFVSKHVELLNWSFAAERKLFASAVATLDIKGDSFNAMHKPPLKVNTFISYGLPVWTNPESYSTEYLLKNGLPVPSSFYGMTGMTSDYRVACYNYDWQHILKHCSPAAVANTYRNIFRQIA